MSKAKPKKPTDETPVLHCIVENGRLVPAFPFDAERLASYRNGTKVYVWMSTDNGSRRLIRKWWAIINWYVKNTELIWSDSDSASSAIKLALNMIVPFKTAKGIWSFYPRSLVDIDDAALEKSIFAMQQVLTDMTGVDQETARREGNSEGDGFPDEPEQIEEHQSPDEIIPPPTSGEAIGAASSTQDSGAGAPTESSDTTTEDNVPEDAASAQPQVGAPVDGAGGYDPIGVEARKWFVSAVLQLWAGTDRGEQALVSSIAKDLKSTVPAIVLRPERDKLNAIVDLCKKVCFQEKKADDAAVEIGVIADMLKPDLDRARATVQKKGK